MAASARRSRQNPTPEAVTPTAAGDPLQRYNEMRRFDRTAEPRGSASRRKPGNAYVVQQHDATRMHFDFRLELDGVLLSWAVPKGPSLSTHDKRLAVQTEDHPIDYRTFEGNIPSGEYGGGAVIVWDHGSWTPEGDPQAMMAKGHLEFTLHGEKLQGRYQLVRLKDHEPGPKSNWLLMKRSDEYAREGEEAEVTARLTRSVLTRLDTDGFVKAVDDNFKTLDADGNGFISKKEIDKAKEDPIFSLKNAFMMDVLSSDYDRLRNLSNDEWFSESSGISRSDMAALGKAKSTGFGAMGAAAGSVGDNWFVPVVAAGGAAAASFGRVAESSKIAGRAGLAALAGAAVTGIYGAIDYQTARKPNLQYMIEKLH